MSMRLSEQSSFSDLDNLNGSDGEPGRQDVGGTNGQTDWVTMKNYTRAVFFSVLGTWHASDDLDECRIQQATSAAGGSAKDLTTDESGGNYDTDNPIDADGDFVIIEVRVEDLDSDNDFEFVRGYVAEGSDTGTDNVASMLTRYGYAYPAKEIQGAAVVGSQVYVDTNT